MQLRKFSLRVPLIFGLCATAISTNAQAPAGPMTRTRAPSTTTNASTQTKSTKPTLDVPRTRNLTGSWKLNKDESTQPRKRDSDSGGQRGGGRSGGGGRGGYGGGMHRRGMSDGERRQMQELMRPSETLDFTQDGTTMKVTDDYDRHRTFYTDGLKIKKSKDAGNQEFDATWQDYRLVADFKGPDGNKAERTFEVLEGNQKLRETIHFTMGRSQREVYLRYVYDLKSASSAAGN